MAPKKARMRRGEPPLADGTLILHGDELVLSELRRAAQDNFDVYDYFGISVFAEMEPDWPWQTVAATKLRRFQWLAIFRAGDLQEAGLELSDTGRAPHYDVVHEDREELVARMLGCMHRLVRNEHHSSPEGGA